MVSGVSWTKALDVLAVDWMIHWHDTELTV